MRKNWHLWCPDAKKRHGSCTPSSKDTGAPIHPCLLLQLPLPVNRHHPNWKKQQQQELISMGLRRRTACQIMPRFSLPSCLCAGLFKLIYPCPPQLCWTMLSLGRFLGFTETNNGLRPILSLNWAADDMAFLFLSFTFSSKRNQCAMWVFLYVFNRYFTFVYSFNPINV